MRMENDNAADTSLREQNQFYSEHADVMLVDKLQLFLQVSFFR